MLTVEVNLGHIDHNMRVLRSNTDAEIFAVVKANAYGHGLERVAHTVMPYVAGYAVTDGAEANRLIHTGVKCDILVLTPLHDAAFTDRTIASAGSLKDLAALKGRARRVAIKVNTGMNRLGAAAREAEALYRAAVLEGFSVESVFTHFCHAEDAAATQAQFALFQSAVSVIPASVTRHACASSCLFLPGEMHFGRVRTGLAMYGYGDARLKPAMQIYTDILAVNRVERGQHIGYGTFCAERNLVSVTARAGYGDGYPRTRGETRYVGIGGKRCKVLGQVCMDMVMADATGIRLPDDGRVYLLGGGIAMADIAGQLNTIPYEILTMINERAVRVYVE